MSNCQVPMPTYERPEPVGELVDSLKRENDALKERVRELEDERRIWIDGWAVNRITELEALVRDMRRDLVAAYHIAGIATELPTPFDRRIRKLGIEVDK